MFKFVLPLFLIILSGGLFFSYIDPVYQSVSDLKDENSQYDEALNKSKELRSVRDSLLSKYNTFLAKDLDRLKKFLPDNVDNVRLIMEIDSMASKYGVVIRKVDIDKSASNSDILGPNTEDFNTINLDFSIEASYRDFVKFLTDLTNNLRIVDIKSLSFRSSSFGLYKYNLGVKTYWLK
ncbi:MAG: type 4a pilus biogenesis protein PilO [Candidatus Pacebacteria bacterium]|nr:type 4a pilus biogenesis protein PilO [Candidatus Paceibacterota bacterium]